MMTSELFENRNHSIFMLQMLIKLLQREIAIDDEEVTLDTSIPMVEISNVTNDLRIQISVSGDDDLFDISVRHGSGEWEYADRSAASIVSIVKKAYDYASGRID